MTARFLVRAVVGSMLRRDGIGAETGAPGSNRAVLLTPASQWSRPNERDYCVLKHIARMKQAVLVQPSEYAKGILSR
jgi:hypothetical protein